MSCEGIILGMKVAYVISFILLILGLIFIFQNLNDVTVRFFSLQSEGPLALAIAVAFLGGFVISLLAIWPGKFITARKNTKLVKENERLQKKLSETAIVFETPGLGKEGEVGGSGYNSGEPVKEADIQDLTGHKD